MSVDNSAPRSNISWIFSIALICSHLHGSAQPVCQTVRDDVDEFTNSHILQITASDFSSGPKFEWVAINGDVCVRLHWRTEQDRPAVVFEGDSLFIKLENDTVLVLKSMETTVGKLQKEETGALFTNAAYCYRVDHAQLAVLSHFWVQKMRIHFREGRHEFQASADATWQMGFWRSANCVRQAITPDPIPVLRTTFGGSKGAVGSGRSQR